MSRCARNDFYSAGDIVMKNRRGGAEPCGSSSLVPGTFSAL